MLFSESALDLDGPLVMVLNVHTQARAWLFPYSFKTNRLCTRAPDHDDLVSKIINIAKQI